MTPQKQNAITVSDNAFTFIADQAASYIAPSKSKPEGLACNKRELVDAMQAFVEKYRYSQEVETNDEGEEIIVEIDRFEVEVNSVLAERMSTTVTRTSNTAKLQSTIQELQAQIAALKGETVES
jgi:hypothetical protein